MFRYKEGSRVEGGAGGVWVRIWTDGPRTRGKWTAEKVWWPVRSTSAPLAKNNHSWSKKPVWVCSRWSIAFMLLRVGGREKVYSRT